MGRIVFTSDDVKIQIYLIKSDGEFSDHRRGLGFEGWL